VEVLRDELKKNQDLLDNVKQVQGDVEKIQDSEAMKRAKAAYERARVCGLRTQFSTVLRTFSSSQRASKKILGCGQRQKS
jgi:hypothetical protein